MTRRPYVRPKVREVLALEVVVMAIKRRELLEERYQLEERLGYALPRSQGVELEEFRELDRLDELVNLVLFR